MVDDNSDVDEAFLEINIKKEPRDGMAGVVVKTEPLTDHEGRDHSKRSRSRSRSRRYNSGSESDLDFGNHFLTEDLSGESKKLKNVLESNLGSLVNKSVKSENYLKVIMKNYQNKQNLVPGRHQEDTNMDVSEAESRSERESKKSAKAAKTKRKYQKRKDREEKHKEEKEKIKKEKVKKENTDKPKKKRRKKKAETEEDSEKEEYIPVVKKKKDKNRPKRKKPKIIRERVPGAEEESDFQFTEYETTSDDSPDEAELFGPIIYKCRHCDVLLRTYELLLRHLTGKHGGFEKGSLCYICGFYHKHRKMIYRHIKEHIEPKKLEKKVCDICSAEVIHLGTHQKVAHSGIHYNCKFCSMKFTRVGQMNIHIKTVHLKHLLEKKFVCQYCNKEFPFQGYLNKHMKTHNHHGQAGAPPHMNTTYTCKHCNLTFNNKHLFRNHKLVCNNNNPLAQGHPSTSSMSEQDHIQQQLQHHTQHAQAAQAAAAQAAAAELSIHQIQSAGFPLKLERSSMYYF